MLSIAKEDQKERQKHLQDLVFGLLDLSVAMFYFVPIFGQKAADYVQAVSLFSLTGIAPYLKSAYIVSVIGIMTIGVLTLALRNYQGMFWVRNKRILSLMINTLGALLFIISSQPYASAILFIFLAIKVVMLIKKQ